MNQFFVKFVPWNEKTLANLINKTIKFSTVYEFNDFNEYRYIGPGESKDGNISKILEKEITNISFLNNLQTLSAERCSKEYKKKIAKFLKDGNAKQLLNPEENCLSLLQENLAFSSVGIFCVSDISVFRDDSAQLMFAHYSQNLKGIALIYEIQDLNEIKEVTCDSGTKFSAGDPKRLIKWYNGDYHDIRDFLCKSKKWEYEKEHRIFSKPGITDTGQHSITLRAILYTARFSGEEKTLFAINDSIYDGNLIIEGIYASHQEPRFMMEKDASETMDFLKNKFSCNK